MLQHLQGHWPQLRPVVLYEDLVARIAAVEHTVREHGLEQRVCVLESSPDAPSWPWR